MDQDATWYEGRPRPRPHCVTWGPSYPPSEKGHRPPIFGPCLLWTNGCPSQLLLNTCSALSPRHVDHCRCCRLSSTMHSRTLTLNVHLRLEHIGVARLVCDSTCKSSSGNDASTLPENFTATFRYPWQLK